MADHDPLCFCDEFGVCICKELERRDARVRADERERIAQQVQAMTPELAAGFNWLDHEEVVAFIRGGAQ